MHREQLPTDRLALWAKLNNVERNGIAATTLPGNRGTGLVATTDMSDTDPILVTVSQELVLSLENVWVYAKADQHLLQVLEAVGEYSRTARGAILIFLLLQLANDATHGDIGVSNPLSKYVKYLPANIPIPTFWDEAERALLTGTSLEAALDAKLRSLDGEFSLLQNKTSSIQWCRNHWWDSGTGKLSFDDWKHVDAMYRSRALDLPGTGHAMVPYIDMANHASGENTTALYETDGNGDAVLVLRDGKRLTQNEEVTITYGDEKGACEMLFSYGFIESTMTSAKELFLDLDIPDDDPLKIAKKAAADSAPGFRLFEQGDTVDWEGSFVWILCVNEEDGLDFKVLQSIEGELELQASWKGTEITDMSKLQNMLEKEELWDVFHLRAVTTLQGRIEQQLLRMEASKSYVQEALQTKPIRTSAGDNALSLRDLEETVMLNAYAEFEARELRLLESTTVQEYLRSTPSAESAMLDDAFS